jgi:hypothetical protein
MKSTLKTIILLFVLFTSAIFAQHQTTKVTDNDKAATVYSYFLFASDSGGTFYSKPFSLDGYMGDSLSTTPFRFVHLYNSAAGLPRVSVVLQVSPDASNWLDGVTLDTGDSVETLTSAAISITSTYAYPYYRLKVTGYAGAYQPYNRSDATAKVWIYAYKRN